ncbi:MAG TPA: hypothetical protein GX704_05005, partial [Clostridiales bacterium]|nr:hypothetical protein [Clostridiales bacterium]
MKTKIRLLSALLLAALLTSFIITSCGADSEKSGETTAPDATAAAETTEAETEPPYEFLKNPEDFGGRTFTVLTGNAEPIDLDDSIKRGDVIIEAIHERNLNTEELLNVKIRSVKSEIDVIKKMSEAV